MKTIYLIVSILLLPLLNALAQETLLQGSITDEETGDPIPDVSVYLEPNGSGTTTDGEGRFSLQVRDPLPLTLFISYVGYESRQIRVSETGPLSVRLTRRTEWMEEIVVSASRIEEDILHSPVSIELLGAAAIRSTASIDYFDALQNLKGVDMVTSALTFKQINTRGFNETGNTRFLQLVDGVDNQTPGLGFAVGNLFGVPDLDVAGVELIPGTASALYGPMAFNGVLLVRTKDPFDVQGLSVQTKTGVNHIGEDHTGPRLLQEYALRYATTFRDRLALKATLSTLSGLDWMATNYEDVDAQTPAELRGDDNPSRDALNIYGDEVTLVLPGIGRISRTGYEERDLMEYDVRSMKLAASLVYKINQDTRLGYQYNFGRGTAPYTGSNRFCLNNFQLQQHRIELVGRNLEARIYGILENSQDSYNARALGQLINRTWVQDLDGLVVPANEADAMWFTRYQEAFEGNIAGVSGGNHAVARSFADEGRFLPGSDAFEREKETFIHIDGLSGAGVFSQSRFYHAETLYDFRDVLSLFELQVGGNARLYDMFTNGTLFDDLDQRIRILEGGFFAQGSRELFGDRLKLMLSTRYDKNENFKGRMTPRAAAVLTLGKNHHFRTSFQHGFRNPTVGDQYIRLNAGVITILGGVPENSADLNVYQNSFEIASVDAFGEAFGMAMAGGSTPEEALLANKDLLVKSEVDYIQPEEVRTFEIGYKSLVGGRFLVDANYHLSSYNDFILNTVVMEPESPVLAGDGSIDPAAAGDILNGNIRLYQLYTNASDRVNTQGATLGLSYLFRSGVSVTANGTWAHIDLREADANHIPAFNTPEFRSNLTIQRDAWNHDLGFQLAWRWQDAFDWVGTFNGLRPGRIEAHSWWMHKSATESRPGVPS
ncbi:MAG: TonB-dependent receptor [Bacteroidales bacterium]